MYLELFSISVTGAKLHLADLEREGHISDKFCYHTFDAV